MTADKFKTLVELRAEINKKYGDDILILGSDVKQPPKHLSTGILSFDLALGGGWPVNQWSEIVAVESTGKTAIAYKTIAHNMDKDPEFTALFVAAEEFVKDHAVSIGVDIDRLWVVETNEMEPAFEIVLKAIENRAVDMVVLDSIPAFVTITELDKDMDEASVATGAKILSNFFKKCIKAQRRSLIEDERGCTMLALNGWRDSIGVRYGDPRTTPGGKAKNYHFFTRTELTRDEWLTQGSKIEDRVGQTIKARVFKNKLAPPQRVGQVDFYFIDTKGGFKQGEFDTIKDIVNHCIALGVIARAGGTYTFEDYKWRGKDCAKLIIPQAVREDFGLQRALIAAAFDADASGAPLATEDDTDE